MKIREVVRVATSISHAYQLGDEDLTAYIQELSVSNDFYVMMESQNGLLLFSPEQESRVPLSLYFEETPKLKDLLLSSDGAPVSFKISTGFEKYKTLAYGSQILDADGNEANLYIFSPLYPVSSTVSILRHQLFYVTALTLVLAFTLAIYFANRISKPIKSMTDTAKEMGKGNYGVKFKGGHYSEIVELADTLTNASRELEKTDMYQKDLIANVSHDLRTPLTMIKSYAEMIRDLSGDNPEKREAHLNVIIDETNRLNTLVNDMLNMSKMQSRSITIERSNFDIKATAESLLASYDILAEQEGYKIKFNCPAPIIVNGDEAKIKQVLSNLITNAVKYCGEDKEIIINIRKTGRKMRCEVIDHGAGIAPDEINHVWERYYKSSTHHVRPTEGSGLGLSIVKEILTLHRANYGVNSKLGKGSTFWFEMDIVRERRK